MASAIDICNLALAHLGEDPTVSSINPPEGSAHSESCARFYPIARDVALEEINWPFAMKRAVLAQQLDAPTIESWLFAYALPADCAKAVAVLQPGVIDEEQNCDDFVIEGSYLYTNAPDATLRYTQRLTDTTKFPPKLVEAISWLLGSYLAGAICDDKNVKTWCYENYRQRIGDSAQSQANQSKTGDHYIPTWIRNR